MKRSEAEQKIKALGAQSKSSVVKGLSYVVTNDPASGSSKNTKARELGVTIIDEKQFLALIQKNDPPSDSGESGAKEQAGYLDFF
jgi:DNA ligase (NAD+)